MDNSSADLERRKLELEIHELSRCWFEKPAYLAVLLPALIGAATVLVAWKSGYFNLQLERQRIEAANLQFQTTRLAAEVKDIKAEKDQLEAQREKLSSEIAFARSEDARLSSLIRQRETALKSIQRDLAIAELTSGLERLLRVAEPSNTLGVQRAINRALSAPSDADLFQSTLAEIRKSLATKDDFSDDRFKLVSEYLQRPTTPPEAKSALETMLRK